jgi:hypothetical protein
MSDGPSTLPVMAAVSELLSADALPALRLAGLATGLTDLDHLTHGLLLGALWVIAATPGAGRTTLACQMPPPLGPGADPAARLSAFVSDYLTFLERQLALVLLSETSTPGARLRTGAHAFWRQHCRYLLNEAGAPHPALRADLLLAGLAAEQVRHWLSDQRHELSDLASALSSAALALTRDACH